MAEINRCCCEINCSTSRQIIIKMIGISREYCNKKAKYFENNKWYCGTHAPSKIKLRSDISFEKWKQSQNTSK